MLVQPQISTHWRKYRRWMKETVLHGELDQIRLIGEFTTTRQRISEDLNQFFTHLSNLAILSGQKIDINDY